MGETIQKEDLRLRQLQSDKILDFYAAGIYRCLDLLKTMPVQSKRGWIATIDIICTVAVLCSRIEASRGPCPGTIFFYLSSSENEKGGSSK